VLRSPGSVLKMVSLALGVITASFGFAFTYLIIQAFGLAASMGSVMATSTVYLYISIEFTFCIVVFLMAYYCLKNALTPSLGSPKKRVRS
jgi:hypothetical protein